MNKLRDYILATKGKTLLLSLDLDNTLVNRDLGSNWVFPKTLELLKKLLDQENFKPIINTGRELIGYNSFCNQAVNINNAILGSGSITLVNGKANFNREGEIEAGLVQIFLEAVRSGKLAFVDFSHYNGRSLFFNKKLVGEHQLQSLFYSQNPRDWFGSQLPPVTEISTQKDAPKMIFRIEFPIPVKQTELFKKLGAKDSGAINDLAKLIGSFEKDNYLLKRKAFFNDDFKGEFHFGRLERSSKFINKGIGLVKWLDQSRLKISDVSIVHIGDRDSGIIDDTLVKRHITNAFMVIVGDKSKADNPHVDLYLKDNVDEAVFGVLELVHRILKADYA